MTRFTYGLAEAKHLPQRLLLLVGRAKLPSNTIGLLVHAAEHTARHVGQLMTTAKVLAAGTKV